MYYMKKRLKLPWMAAIFAVATIFSSFGTGSLPQINSISNSAFATFGINKILTGAVLAVLLGFVIIGGIKRIAKVTARLVPLMALIYFIGAIAVIAFNYQNIWPSLVSVVNDLFTGSAASGGFLGAGFAYAFNRGVNRGLFSNEAGQGSAPIAHAAARAHEPVSEGMVALLEPFIDTIIICSLTGLTLLASGVWNQKFENRFQQADTVILSGNYTETNTDDALELKNFLQGGKNIKPFSGDIEVHNGEFFSNITILHARSVAENVRLFNNGQSFSGTVMVVEGKPQLEASMYIEGKSLIHSAPLTTEAFSKSWLGKWGRYIVTIGLLLFAFSTAISWSYYGDRAVTFLFGVKYVNYYRVVYVVGFFLAAFADTTIVWIFSGITIAFMTIPNLIGILSLSKEMKIEVEVFRMEWKAWLRLKKSGKIQE